jgi:hypothetical protein
MQTAPPAKPAGHPTPLEQPVTRTTARSFLTAEMGKEDIKALNSKLVYAFVSILVCALIGMLEWTGVLHLRDRLRQITRRRGGRTAHEAYADYKSARAH